MEVISAYDSELKNNPQYEIAWNNKGSALNNLFRFKEGLAAVGQLLISIRMIYLPGKTNGVSLTGLEWFTEAQQAIETVLKFDPNFEKAQRGQRRMPEKSWEVQDSSSSTAEGLSFEESLQTDKLRIISSFTKRRSIWWRNS